MWLLTVYEVVRGFEFNSLRQFAGVSASSIVVKPRSKRSRWPGWGQGGAITMRTFSSVEYCRRVARRISRTAFSASSECFGETGRASVTDCADEGPKFLMAFADLSSHLSR